MPRRLLMMALAAAAPVAWWLASPARAADQAPQAKSWGGRPLPVRVVAAELSTEYAVERRYTGTFVAPRRSRLGFERAGRVKRLLVDEGASVAAGQPLAELDRRHVAARRRQAAARLAEAEAVLAELVAGPRSQTIASAEADVRSFAAQRDSAEQNLQRARALVETRAISREEFDNDLFEFRAMQAQVDAAQKELDELLAGTREEQIVAQRARVEQLGAELADLDHDIEDTTLRAPFAGTVVQRLMDDGAIVSPGEAVFELIDREPPELWVGLPARIAASLSPGDALRGEVDGRPLSATVRSLRPDLDTTTRTRNVVFTIAAKASPNPVAGQLGRVVAVETVQERGFWAPTDALTPRKRGLWAVYVATGDGRERVIAARDVEVLHNDGDRSFVRGTLSPGEAVVATGAHRVVEGQRVVVQGNTP